MTAVFPLHLYNASIFNNTFLNKHSLLCAMPCHAVPKTTQTEPPALIDARAETSQQLKHSFREETAT
jgi:hypothetical protein